MDKKDKIISITATTIEDDIISVIESDYIYTLKSFYEEWSEMAEKEGESLFAALCPEKDVENIVIAGGMVKEVFERVESRMIKRFRVFFDSFFKKLMAEEKESFWDVSRRFIRYYQEVIERLDSGEIKLGTPYGLEYFIPDPEMWLFTSFYLAALKDVFKRLEFEYEVT